MNYLSNKLLVVMLLTLVLSISKSYSQSESEEINTLIEQKKAFNKTNKNSLVYKIQLYNGNETDAYQVKRNFEATFPEYPTKMIYSAPEWKMQVGDFKTRLDADRVLIIIQEKFAGAIVLEDKI